MLPDFRKAKPPVLYVMDRPMYMNLSMWYLWLHARYQFVHSKYGTSGSLEYVEDMVGVFAV